MLSLLLDENISPEVVRQVTEKRPDIVVTGIGRWQGGRFMAAPDTAILTAAVQEGMTLVTYDQKTIVPVLVQWGQAADVHAGVVFVDERSIASNDFGALVRALTVLWDAAHTEEWTNRVDFLRPAP